MKQTFILIAGGIPFVFVVPPLDLSIQSDQLNATINLIDWGEVEKVGYEKPKKISFSTFLPSIKSQFYNSANPLPPIAGILALETIKKNKTSCVLTVPELGLFFYCKIQTLNYQVIERTGDINISISLVENREEDKIINKLTGLFKRGG